MPSYRSFQTPHIVLPQLDITNSPSKMAKQLLPKSKYKISSPTKNK